VLSGNSLRIIVLDNKEKEEKKKKIIKKESIKEEAVKRKEKKYTVTLVPFIALIDLIAY
jgi:hypothetical protein